PLNRPPPASTPFPYTTLFRSERLGEALVRLDHELSVRLPRRQPEGPTADRRTVVRRVAHVGGRDPLEQVLRRGRPPEILERLRIDRKSTRLNSSHVKISYAVF